MRFLILLGCCLLIAFAILALSCDKPKTPALGIAPGVIWNRANATVMPYVDYQLNRSTDDGLSDPSDAPPVYLVEPCSPWKNQNEQDWRRSMLRAAAGINPCIQCHCFAFQPPIGYCVDVTGAVVLRSDWNNNPDSYARGNY